MRLLCGYHRPDRQEEAGIALSVGDHFYFSGVSSVDDPRWRRSFENVYPARSQRRATRLFSGLSEEGNAYIKDHDVAAQLAGAVRLLAAERPRYAAAFLSRVFKAMADEQLGLDPASLEHPPSPVSMKPRNC